MRTLLGFLVEKSLAGEGARLKAYAIAVDALGRDPDFDAQLNSYPRVQVGRLRKLLDEFYTENGAGAGLRIRIPKGAYVVDFEMAADEPDDSAVPIERPAAIASSVGGSDDTPWQIGDLGRFAAALFVAAMIALFAWQAMGGLASADSRESEDVYRAR
ncbi:hypothetical protein HFP57_12225 [Parasphingopyxis algicola]|uniref:hypothetical protein n=1 Tax=Parasphingopyxis algicola TaxID=2026624 RepID=UPI0015A1DF0F|nr:hypothetical protein [Parasphingopyxis algicola]QLC25708.1 hypothetical protein HFP57_12225 [Parasphingopyxis algicola]